MRYTTLILVIQQFRCGIFKRISQLGSLTTADLGNRFNLDKQVAVDQRRCGNRGTGRYIVWECLGTRCCVFCVPAHIGKKRCDLYHVLHGCTGFSEDRLGQGGFSSTRSGILYLLVFWLVVVVC